MPYQRMRNYATAFNFFKDRELGRAPKLFMKIGTVLFAVYFVSEAVYVLFGLQKLDPSMSWVRNTLGLFGGVGFLGGSLMLALVSVYYIGSQHQKYTFIPALLITLKKVAQFVLLPAVLVMISMPIVAIIFYGISKLFGG